MRGIEPGQIALLLGSGSQAGNAHPSIHDGGQNPPIARDVVEHHQAGVCTTMRSLPPKLTACKAGAALSPRQTRSRLLSATKPSAQILPAARKHSLLAVQIQHRHRKIADVVVVLEKRDQISFGRDAQTSAAAGLRFRRAPCRSDIRSDSCRPPCAIPPTWNHPATNPRHSHFLKPRAALRPIAALAPTFPRCHRVAPARSPSRRSS